MHAKIARDTVLISAIRELARGSVTHRRDVLERAAEALEIIDADMVEAHAKEV